MKKNANNKLKLDKKTVSRLNSTEEVNVNGGRAIFPFPKTTIIDSCFCMTEACFPTPVGPSLI
jgi:hypothetical protein